MDGGYQRTLMKALLFPLSSRAQPRDLQCAPTPAKACGGMWHPSRGVRKTVHDETNLPGCNSSCWLDGGQSATNQTATPVKHLVVIFDENVSFDHYFGTYPNALNPPHETAFKARLGTPQVNGLTPMLLERNRIS